MEHPGTYRRWDIPGYYAIGSGKHVALQMMQWRELNVNMTPRKIIYHAFEAKIFSEQSPGVGAKSDIYIAKLGQRTKIKTETEEYLESVWDKCQPRVPPGRSLKIPEADEVFAKK